MKWDDRGLHEGCFQEKKNGSARSSTVLRHLEEI